MRAAGWQEWLGIGRSLLMYYGIPGRRARMQAFYAKFIQPGDLCFDIGAHVGNRLPAWSALQASVVAVEPQPQLMRILRGWYGTNPRVTLVEEAVGEMAGTATLHISRRTPTVSTLSQDWMNSVRQDRSFRKVQWNDEVTVPVTTLDALIGNYGIPAFCKIDVEGFELEVLKGLSQPLPALSFECIPASRHIALGCIARLGELGEYRFSYSPGESHRLMPGKWQTPEDMVTMLQGISTGSGDVYAKRVDQDRLRH